MKQAQDLYGAGAQGVDFSNPAAAAGIINAWVSEQTHGKITNLIPASAMTPFTALILTNAIYFKGDWASAFNADFTESTAFKNSPTQTSTVQMMYQEGYFGYYEQTGPNGFQALDLPYQGNNVDMIVILPTNSTLDNVESTFTPDLFTQITSSLYHPDVHVLFPKFKLEEAYDLGKPLSNLSMQESFGTTPVTNNFTFAIH